ncbi:Kinesin-like protein kif27 [Chytriomyces hyalinus]|nr:Kinesin-like protein kif27 [Chytriomyces hyalinus]
MSEELHAAARSNRPSFPSQSQSNNALYSHPQQQTPRTLQSTDSTGTNSKRSDQLQIPSATRRSNSNAQLRWQSSHTEQEQRSTAVSLQTSTSVLEIDEEEGFADLREGDDVYKFNPSVVSLTNGTRAAGIDDEVAGSVVISVPQITLPRSSATSVQLVPAVPVQMVDNTAELDQEASYKSAFSIKSLPFMKKAKQKFLRKPISQSSKGLAWWNFAIDILHLTLLIMIPVQLAWTHHFVNDEWVVFYLLIDAIMVTDCYILARVDFKDEYGILIHDSDRILKRYLFECSGILHIMASLPWELVHYAVWSENPVTLSALGPSELVDPLLFYQRKIWALVLFTKTFLRAPLLRIYQIHIPSLAVPIARLIKCMLILLLIGHVDACLFWFIDFTLPSSSDRWIEHTNLIHIKDTHDPVPFSTQYLVSYLAALRSLVLKLRECSQDTENIFVIFEFVSGILAYGTVFGNIHSIIELLDSTAAMNQAEEYHNFEMEGIISFMKEKGIRPELQQMVRDYKELQWQKSKGLDEDHFFIGIPKSVQQEIKSFLYLGLVQKVPIFQGTDFHFQQTLAFKIKPMHVLNGWHIFRKGDEGDEMFFIKSGNVEICSEDGTIIFVTLTDGAFFGEIALFESCHRTATARAKGNCELCTLSKEDFNILMNLYPTVAEGIRETIQQRKIQEEAKKKQAELEAARLRAEEENRLALRTRSKAHMSSTLSKLTNNGLLGGGLLAGLGGRRQSMVFAKRGSMFISPSLAHSGSQAILDVDELMSIPGEDSVAVPRHPSEYRKDRHTTLQRKSGGPS